MEATRASAVAFAIAIAGGGCGLISGASELHVGGEAVGTTDGAADLDETGVPPGSEAPADAAASVFDGAVPPSEAGPTRIRELTFENGKLTGLYGGDSVVGTPLAKTFSPIDGTYSMLVDNDNSYVQANVGALDELYATYLVRYEDLSLGDVVVARFVVENGLPPVDVVASKDGVALRTAGNLLNGSVPVNESNAVFRVGVHVRAGTGNGVVELFAAPRGGAFGAPAVSSTTLTLGRITAVRLGAVGNGNATLDFDDLLLDTGSMPSP
jgi:hypothetical protein